MIRTKNYQINTRVYWNYIYNTPAKKQDYWNSTERFPSVLRQVKDGDKFLDIGCGVGIPSRMVLKERKDCEAWGVDISDDIIEANRKDEPKGKWYHGYIGALDFLPKDYFDVIFAGEVIEHLDNPLVLFKEAYGLLKKGGKLIITTPRNDSVESSEHVWYINENDLETFFFSTGFKNLRFVNLDDMEYLMVYFAIGKK